MRSLRTVAVAILVLAMLWRRTEAGMVPWEVSALAGPALDCLLGMPVARVALLACAPRCVPIPWQLDERATDGTPIFTGGDLASTDESPGVIDSNDEIVFMPVDGGPVAPVDQLPPSACRLALRAHRAGQDDRWIYAVAYADDAPRSSRRYVRYDPASDVLSSDAVVLGFRDRIPQTLSVPIGGATANLLDRLKVRASARFLGLIPVSRDEGDLEVPAVGWRDGPVRAIRRQQQRIRVGWGIKSPRFVIDTYFERNSATMPVVFRLNFPPTYFFSDISVEASLDFRDLRGWQVLLPGMQEPVTIQSPASPALRALDDTPAEWFALINPRVQLLQRFEVTDSLQPLEKRIVLRVTAEPHPPEAVVGELPGIGYVLRGWGAVSSGTHAFAAVTYALPRDQNLGDFLRDQAVRSQIEVVPLTATGR